VRVCACARVSVRVRACVSAAILAQLQEAHPFMVLKFLENR